MSLLIDSATMLRPRILKTKEAQGVFMPGLLRSSPGARRGRCSYVVAAH